VRIVSYTKARNSLKRILDSVVDDADCTLIVRRDAEDAVLMSLEHYNGLMETLHLLSSPANAAHLQKSIDQHRSGSVSEHALVDD
jgi:antitoxin YefM